MNEAAEAQGPRRAPTDPVTELQGVGPVTAERLAAAGIRSIVELLGFFPRRAQALVDAEGPDDSLCGQGVRLRGTVEKSHRAWLPGRRSLVEVRFVAPDGGQFVVSFFNQPYLLDTYKPGLERQIEGRLVRRGERFVLENPRVVSAKMDAAGDCVVRYPEIEGVSEARLRALIHQALRAVPSDTALDQGLPPELAAEFPTPADALRAMHEPTCIEEHEAARRRFAVGEAVALFRSVEARRRLRESWPGPRIVVDAEHEKRRRQAIPFAWTGDQARAVAAIRARLAGPGPMGLLLQGDVGSGKTAVAIDAALATQAAGFQVAMLAPTELLAEQHYALLSSWLEPLGLSVGFLSAKRPADERAVTERGLSSGELKIVVGTHALFSGGTRFARLGLVIVDEQHRFGVEQRTRLVQKGEQPHVLVMTATPIPRTLTLTRFGDLDVEVLRERPAGRGPAPAVFVEREDWPRILRAMHRHVRRGGRVYVVCPKIGEDGQKGGAVRVEAELQRQFRTALVHGRLPVEERQRRTAAFRAGETDLLVGTTVLEVGVDVAEASLMVVVGSERFGLATLHQLRGRVGRGSHRGLCILTGERSPRGDAIRQSRDGFELAELDLRLRGAGELLGARQSGAHDFRALDPVDDYEILRRARESVRDASPRR